MNDRKASLAETAAALASAAMMAWMMMPPQERLWVKLTLLGKAHRLASAAARRTGRKGMADELAGRDLQRYQVACWLSQARDQLGAVLQGMRA